MNRRLQTHAVPIFRAAANLSITLLCTVAATIVTAGDRLDIAFATQLTEVKHGTHNGRDYLTINIGARQVGPVGCQSNVVHLDHPQAQRREQIEALALSAMLSADIVMIVLPMDAALCVDGKPVFTDLYLLPASM